MTAFYDSVKRNLLNPAGWGEIVRDWVWQLAPAHEPGPDPGWTPPPSALEGASILWPTTYEWAEAAMFAVNLIAGLRRLIPVTRHEIPQPYPGIILIRLARGGRLHDLAIDYSDDSDYINKECVERSSVYFKMQYLRLGYGDERIIPGGYISKSSRIYNYLSKLRRIKDSAEPEHEVYGRFSLDFASEVRRKAVALLTAEPRLRFTGGTKTVRYGQYLREVARSRICLDLPGNGDFTFRFMDYLAIGSCIVGPPQRTAMPVPLIDRQHVIHCAPDLSDLTDLCRHYLEDAEECRRISTNARQYFDQHLHRDRLACYYLNAMLERTR